ncbi:hypothetical protein M569_13082, partial [Genlisea aurea]
SKMGRNGKLLGRWRNSFFKFSPSRKKPPPPEYVCPISRSLMFDPYVVSSGQSFEGLSVEICRDLGFAPTLPDGSTPDFTSVVPNSALKNLIRSWCADNGSGHPDPPVRSQVESIVRSLMASSCVKFPKIRASESELIRGMPENPPVLFTHADSEMNPRNLYNSSSSEESVIANSSALLPFATRPSCLSPSSSSEIVSGEMFNGNGSSESVADDENFVVKMRSLDVYEQEQAVILLRKTTRNDVESRAALCSERLLLALKQMLDSRYAAVQINAAAALVNLSLEKCNKVKILRSGVVPLLIDVLRNGSDEAREHAAGAIFSLAVEDENRTAIGVLGAIQPLLHELRSGTRRSRHDSSLALYHLTLAGTNRTKLIHLGAAAVLLRLLKDAEMAAPVSLVLCNLASCGEGRAALLHANAVECLVDVLRSGPESSSESTVENCAAALYQLSESVNFRALAMNSGAPEVLAGVEETGSKRAKEKARRILEILRCTEIDQTAEVDWESVMKNGVTRA